MHRRIHQPRRRTVGLLAGWPFYTGQISKFLATFYRGLDAAAREHGCNLLIGCGLSPRPQRSVYHVAWPTIAPDQDFVPVGPWNTDGLIVVLPLSSSSRSRYVQEVIASGHPVVCVGAGEGGRMVMLDNDEGIRQAMGHLVEHGHREIAFIAGVRDDAGDSAERLAAYRRELERHGLPYAPELVAWGHHYWEGGQQAMRQIMDAGRPFSAVIGSNDATTAGALEELRRAGLRVPEDVALIGFDDAVEARSATPPLTTIHAPLSELGWRALAMVLQAIDGQVDGNSTSRVPTRLVIRQSCGCQPGLLPSPVSELEQAGAARLVALGRRHVIKAMVEVVQAESFYMGPDEAEALCAALLEACERSLEQAQEEPFLAVLGQILDTVEAYEDDPHVWQMALSAMEQGLLSLAIDQHGHAARPEQSVQPLSGDRRGHVTRHLLNALLHQGRIQISERSRRQHSHYVLAQDRNGHQVGHLTARLMEALDELQIAETLAEELPLLGINRAPMVLFEPEGDDPVAWSVLIGGAEQVEHHRFPTRAFPPRGYFSDDEGYRLALVPLVTKGYTTLTGFIAFDVAHLNLYSATIVQHVTVALRSARLYRDATEGRRLAEEANRMKSRFLSVVSHELRTPISLIVGLSEMLLRAHNVVQVPLPAFYKQDVEQIHTSAQYLNGLIRDVLDLASTQVGQLRLACEPLDIGDALQAVARTGEELAHTKGLAWVARIEPDLPPVWGDRTRLRQVALNLISNAVKFTASGAITLEIGAEGESLCVRVSDTGLGIPESDQEAIFDEFRQSDRTMARGYGGMGLGLAICKRIVELHGGTIGMISSGVEGAGSTFFFKLPRMEQRAYELAQTPLPQNRQETVLLLTDAEHRGQRVRAYLGQQGYAVDEQRVDIPGVWLSRLLADPPGAILLEQELGAKWGWEILQQLKSDPAMQHLPVLIYALRDHEESGAMIELEYLTKPVETSALAEVLERFGWLEEVETEKAILIVDDDAGIRDMHARIVQSHGPTYQVLQAGGGEEALEILRRQHVDMVLLDLMMPGMDGFAVLEALRANETTRNIPVIVLSAQVLSEAEMARLNSGVVSVLGKGVFTVDETLSHVAAALSRSRRLGGDAQRLVRKAMAYMHTHYADQVARADMASYVGVSESYLNRCFDQELGISPMTYLSRYRVSQAKTLLTTGDESVTEIALKVGFGSAAYFCRVFQREVGLSPGAYRQSHRGKFKAQRAKRNAQGQRDK